MASGDWWTVVDLTIVGSGRHFEAKVRHPAGLLGEMDDEDEAPRYWYLQAMNLLDPIVRELGEARVLLELSYLPDVAVDLLGIPS